MSWRGPARAEGWPRLCGAVQLVRGTGPLTPKILPSFMLTFRQHDMTSTIGCEHCRDLGEEAAPSANVGCPQGLLSPAYL